MTTVQAMRKGPISRKKSIARPTEEARRAVPLVGTEKSQASPHPKTKQELRRALEELKALWHVWKGPLGEKQGSGTRA